MDNINELAIDISLKKVAEYNDHPLYTSSTLTKKFIDAIKIGNRSKPYANDYIRLVEKKKLIPCYYTKVFLRVFELEIKDLPSEAKHIVGFYLPEEKKICILIDHKENIITQKYADFLAETTIHELTHMFSSEYPKQFISLFGETLLKFYVPYFTKVFKLKGDITKETKNIINFMYNYFELTRMYSTRKLYEIIFENFSKITELNTDDFENLLLKYCNVVMMYIHYGMMDMLKSRSKYSDILDPIKDVYKSEFNNIVPSIHIQELFIPSEVICILSESDKSSKYNKMISFLASKA
jgi:hypothetical protein